MEKSLKPEMMICEKDPSITIIETVEDMDLYSSLKLKEYFNSLRTAGWKRFIVDLSKTRYIDSSGLGALIHMFSNMKNNTDVDVRVTNVAPTIFQVIKLTHLENFFRITNDVESAVGEMRADSPGSEVLPSYSITDIVAQVTDIIAPEKKKSVQAQKEPEIRQLQVSDTHELFNKTGLEHKRFFLDNDKLRKVSASITNGMPVYFREINNLEHQIYELLKNALKHGNNGKIWKPVKVWYSTCSNYAHIIIEDAGKGFRKLEEWNEFYRQRMLCYYEKDEKRLLYYLSFKTEESDKNDSGTAMFSAIEYWNKGIIFNEKRNAVAVKRTFE